ncbi:HAD family hydrolase [Geomicrobium sediminis]|uniref:Hydrolase of the HAD superfamily n=1 Tax=Geomicrobium sediminis TaxID=1347788 RepID=A0ABS2PI51_9BACL|nr:HAD family hydrolase [Geomicrobium sediminis]MBM7635021.1 putative hydrolase of the HAD superfamily [Geomicrobium sediminis]
METNLFKESELIIFDLDGTLYEDTDHFDYYAKTLSEEVIEEHKLSFFSDYELMKKGNHAVSIGKAYDVQNDWVLEVDPFTGNIERVVTWEGEKVADSTWREIHEGPVEYDFDQVIAIGDGWWLPNVAARHYGVKDPQPAYHKTKEFMATDAFTLSVIEGLREGLLSLKEKKSIVLLTNSTDDDVERLLKLLHLEGVFHEVVTNAMKPQETRAHFISIMKRYNVTTEQTLSIGDNYLNEIIPAKAEGMKAIYIDLDNGAVAYGDRKVTSVSELIEEMKEV